MRNTKFYLAIILILAGAFAADAQMLAIQYTYERVTSPSSGKQLFVLDANPQYSVDKMKKGEGFSVVGAVVEPEEELYTLLFVNAARNVNFQDATASLTLDGQRLVFPKFKIKPLSEVNGLQIQMLGIDINRLLFDKIRRAKSAVLTVGTVAFPLGQDDFDALNYLAMRIETRILAPEFLFYADKDEMSQIPYLTLNADPDVVRANAAQDKPTLLLGAVAQPELNRAFLMFINCRREVLNGENMQVEIDGQALAPLGVTLTPSGSVYAMKMRVATAEINLELLRRLARAKSVKISVGDSAYTLDQNNLDALAYLQKQLDAPTKAQTQPAARKSAVRAVNKE